MRILTDTAADYEWKELLSAGIEYVPIRVYFGEEEFPLRQDDFKARFFAEMAANVNFPRTSQPSPQDYLPIFREVRETGDSLIAVLISSALSGTYQSAVLARDMVGYDQIYLIDSLSVSSGQRILLETACRMRGEGVPAEQIAGELTLLKSRIRMLAIIDELENLYRGGRLSRVQLNIGKFAHLKPIITLDEQGAIQVQGRYIGRNKADTSLIRLVEEDGFDPAYGLYFLYADDPRSCNHLIEKAKARLGEQAVRHQTALGATIGAHTGNGAYGLFYVRRGKE